MVKNVSRNLIRNVFDDISNEVSLSIVHMYVDYIEGVLLIGFLDITGLDELKWI